MKMQGLIVALLTVATPLCAIAGWQVSKSDSSIPREPFFQAAMQQNPGFSASANHTNQFSTLGQPAAAYAVSISGSLKENMERIMSRYHWRVIWKAPYDYNFDGRVAGSSLPNVIEKLLEPFPVQAVMYMSNRTLMVVPRAKA